MLNDEGGQPVRTSRALSAAPDLDPEPVLPAGYGEVYETQWWPMVRLATGLVRSVPLAEEIVQDAFEALYERWDALRDPAAAAGYLRVSVVNGARSALRRSTRARKYLVGWHEDTAESADHSALLRDEHESVRRALAALPDRQREVLTLRYLQDLPDVEIAAATGLSIGGVRSASSRGLAALRVAMGELL
jgi:RNA polymerase sigma factor (sigma-70 family)